jgi:excisionase family DNA binding protein
MKLDSLINREKWYTVWEVSQLLEWSQDTIRRWIYRGKLRAFIAPGREGHRHRRWRGTRILGAELIRFLEAHLTQA